MGFYNQVKHGHPTFLEKCYKTAHRVRASGAAVAAIWDLKATKKRWRNVPKDEQATFVSATVHQGAFW